MTTHRKNSQPKVFKVAIIGLGNQSLNDHIPALLRRTDISISEVCDLNESSIRLFESKFSEISESVEKYNDIYKMPLNVDFCIVSLPHGEYFKVAKYLVSKKIPFIKEKPFARNKKEMMKILSIPGIEKYCFICSQRRYNPIYIQALSMKEKLGNLYLFNAVYKLKILEPHIGWRGNKKIAGGGCLIDMGYHIIDQLLWWFGEPDQIFTSTSSLAIPDVSDYAEDTAIVSFKYKDGLHGTIILSRTAGEKKEEYLLVGSKGQLCWNKKSLLLNDKEGTEQFSMEIDDDKKMMDIQLQVFINRIINDKGFEDIILQHKMNMEFIEKCYLLNKN